MPPHARIVKPAAKSGDSTTGGKAPASAPARPRQPMRSSIPVKVFTFMDPSADETAAPSTVPTADLTPEVSLHQILHIL
jgi:hypothetical protein